MGKRARRLLAAAALVFGSVVIAPSSVSASSYNNTNPGATICGNGTYPIRVWASGTVYVSGVPTATVALRRSDHCNTVWTRVTNLTGNSISVMEKIEVFSANYPVAMTIDSDTVPAYASGWSYQVDYPSASPPEFRATGLVQSGSTWVSGTTTTLGSGVTASWTRGSNNTDSGFEPQSCMTTTAWPCVSWGEPGGTYATIQARFDANVPSNLVSATTNIVIPAWNPASPKNPLIQVCPSCSEQVLVKMVDLGSGGPYATTPGPYVLNGSGTIGTFTHQTVQLNTWPSLTRSCSSEGSCPKSVACPAGGFVCDDRAVISHEFGHVQGLGHCRIDLSVMCNMTTLFWTPQQTDQDGLYHVYP